MSSPTREQVYTALFNHLTPLLGAGFNSVGRKLRFLEDMKPPEMPALIVAVGNQKIAPKPGVPPRRTYSARVFVYAAAPEASVASGIELNGLIDLVEAALAPANVLQPLQTLGGVVAHAWVEGTIEIYEAIKTQRAAALIPITMLVP